MDSRRSEEQEKSWKRSVSSVSASWAADGGASADAGYTVIASDHRARRPSPCSTKGEKIPASTRWRGRHDRHHHGPRHARGRRSAVRRRRHRAGLSGQAGHRHELDLADRDQEIRGEDQRARLRLYRCAGSGGEVGAKAATLTIMVGGPEAAFERVKPMFE